MNSFKRLCAGVMLVLTTLNAQASWEQASQVMADVTGQMLDLVKDESLTRPENIDQMIAEIERVMAPVADYEYIGKSIMGKYTRQASDAETARFADVFKLTMMRAYAKAVVGFEFQTFEVLPPAEQSPEPDKQIVSVLVKSANGQEYNLVYYVVLKEGHWNLVNATVDGVNLRITFRNQFADLMSQYKTISAVIDHWEEVMSKDSDTAAAEVKG